MRVFFIWFIKMFYKREILQQKFEDCNVHWLFSRRKIFCHQSYSIIDYEILGNDIDKGNYIVSDKMKEKTVERLKISFDAKISE